MTPEQEDDLIEKMAREICSSDGYHYDGDELYKKFARTALSIAKPIIRDEAIREHLEVADELPAQFDKWRSENAEMIRSPVLQSLLYDINLLPEQVLTFKSIKMMRYLVAVVEHFKMARNEASEEAAVVAENLSFGIPIDEFREMTKKDHSARACIEAASAIRALKSKGQKL